MKQSAPRTTTLTVAAVVLLGAAALAPSAHATQSADQGHRATRAALRALVEQGKLPGVAARVQDGKGKWSATAGYADTATHRERSTAEHFRGASITKTFIATVLLQLEAEGKLSLQDTVERWLPGLVRGHGYDGGTITLRSLLNHTSGIANYTDDPAIARNSAGLGFPTHRYDTYTPEELVAAALKQPPHSHVAAALKQPPHSHPESSPKYSNTTYVIAGMVIERVTGRSYAQEVTRRIINPLKLRGTSFPGTAPQLPSPHPVGYSRLHQDAPGAEVIDATEQNMTWLGAAGDVISTTGDLNRFQRALMRGVLLPPAQMKDMLREVPDGEVTGYGLGLEFARLSCGIRVVGKTGRTNGSLSAMVGTTDGRHQLTFNINGDWLPDSTLYINVIEAEFCGTSPTQSGRR